ncbi:MAG: lytic transglycosylase domain-containing protein [Candidatus Eremiobacteraeota bacterium]|nr:lytic transglycosylase domain-containing protein [Candidatus Eremiobacteraeota bacterium]
MYKYGLGILALLSLTFTAQARPRIEMTGSEKSAGQVVNSYSNCVPHLPTKVLRASAPPRGPQSIYSYSDSAHRKLEQRIVSYSAWDGSQWAPAQVQLNSVIEEEARRANLDPLIIEIIVKHESAFNPSATSGVGAQGLMQLLPETAADLGCKNAYDPVQNVAAGTRYFADLYRQFGDLSLALAAYNAGPGNVTSCGGVPPYEETQNYVASIAGEYLSRRKKRGA